MERMMTRGRDRIADRSRDCRAAEDHQAADSKDDQPAADTCAEDRTRMEGKQGVSGSVPAERDGVIQ